MKYVEAKFSGFFFFFFCKIELCRWDYIPWHTVMEVWRLLIPHWAPRRLHLVCAGFSLLLLTRWHPICVLAFHQGQFGSVWGWCVPVSVLPAGDERSAFHRSNIFGRLNCRFTVFLMYGWGNVAEKRLFNDNMKRQKWYKCNIHLNR